MTAYEVEDTIYTLEFDDRPGAEIVCRAGSVKQHLKALSLDWVLTREAFASRFHTDEEVDAELTRLFDIFADHIQSWNLTLKRQPVPITADGLMSLDREFAKTAATAWLRGVFGISAPLEQPSGPTETESFDESLIPMVIPPSPIPLAS
jgi:hypothetical protein